MNHPHSLARKAPEPLKVEIERVVETGRRSSGEPVHFDVQTSALPIPDEREQKLIAASVRRWGELVKDGDVGATPSRPQPVSFGTTAARKVSHRATGLPKQCAWSGWKSHSLQVRRALSLFTEVLQVRSILSSIIATLRRFRQV
jgi:hypothetical protein